MGRRDHLLGSLVAVSSSSKSSCCSELLLLIVAVLETTVATVIRPANSGPMATPPATSSLTSGRRVLQVFPSSTNTFKVPLPCEIVPTKELPAGF